MIWERACRETDYRFFMDLIVKTLKPYVEEYQKFDHEYVRDSFRQTWPQMKMIMSGSRRIGFYQIEGHEDTLMVKRIFLSPAYQKKGIGKRIMKEFENLGYKRIRLEVWDNNPAVDFYKNLGYKVKKKEGHKVHMERSLNQD